MPRAPSLLAPVLRTVTNVVVILVVPLFPGFLTPLPAAAQEPGPEPVQEIREAMSALPDLVGEWQGEGWIRRGPGEPHAILSRETVEPRLDGQIWLIEGRHHSKEDPSRQVFHAFAVLSYDPEAGVYRFRSHTDDGRGGDFEGRVEKGAFLWSHEVPGGRIRYTLQVEDDRWHEVGTFSADGETWTPFFEMTLTRTRR